MHFTSSLVKACESNVIVISVDAQSLRSLVKEIVALKVRNKAFVLCTKGIEIKSGCRLSEIVLVMQDNVGCRIAIWTGPGHVQD